MKYLIDLWCIKPLCSKSNIMENVFELICKYEWFFLIGSLTKMKFNEINK